MNFSLFRSRFIVLLNVSMLLFPFKAFCVYDEIETKRVPLERLLTNLGNQLKKRPNDVRTLVNLGRLHAMAYSMELS